MNKTQIAGGDRIHKNKQENTVQIDKQKQSNNVIENQEINNSASNENQKQIPNTMNSLKANKKFNFTTKKQSVSSVQTLNKVSLKQLNKRNNLTNRPPFK